MNGNSPHKTPADALRAQLQELGGLRNASARDAAFKAWRQNTLTLIQRVWGDDGTRAERFRRIPFSTPSSKSGAAATKQNFERGCSEAIWLMREWIEDARRTNLTFGEPGGSGAPTLPGSQEDDFPVLDLPVDGSTAEQVSNRAVNTTPIGPEAPLSPMSEPRAPGARSEAPPPPLVSPFAEPLELPPATPKAETTPKPSKQGKASRSTGQAKPAESPRQAPVAKAPPAPPAPKQPAVAKAPPAPPAPPAPRQPVAAKAPPAPPAPPQPVAANPPPPPPAEPEAPPTVAAAGFEADLDAAFDAFMGSKGSRKSRGQAGSGSAPKRALKEMLGFTDDASPAVPPEPLEFPRSPQPEASLAPEPVHPVDDVAEVEAGAEAGPAPERALPFEIVTPQEAAPEPPIAFVRPTTEAPAPPVPMRDVADASWSGALETRNAGAAPPTPGGHGRFAGSVDVPASFDEADLPDFEVVSEDLEAPLPGSDQPPATAGTPPADLRPTAAPRDGATAEAAEMNDFLNRSPVLGASPKPVRPRAVLPLRSPTATTLATLAAEVGHLGVPEGQRAAVRAMLLDLAREFDESRASWEIIRHAVVFVMEYPPLARRVLPLLIPYLDQAA